MGMVMSNEGDDRNRIQINIITLNHSKPITHGGFLFLFSLNLLKFTVKIGLSLRFTNDSATGSAFAYNKYSVNH